MNTITDAEWIVEVRRREGIAGDLFFWQIGTSDGRLPTPVEVGLTEPTAGECGDPQRGRRPRLPEWVEPVGDWDYPSAGTPALFGHPGEEQWAVLPIADPRRAAREAAQHQAEEWRQAYSAQEAARDAEQERASRLEDEELWWVMVGPTHPVPIGPVPGVHHGWRAAERAQFAHLARSLGHWSENGQPYTPGEWHAANVQWYAYRTREEAERGDVSDFSAAVMRRRSA